MGEDCHLRIYVRSKSSKEYFNAHDICEWDPKYSLFQDIVGERNYDFFSLFGSCRGNYTELNYANYGLPDFLKNTDFDKYCHEFGYYGFIWFKLPELKKSVLEYIVRLRDPFKYLDADSYEYELWSDLKEHVKNDGGIEKLMEQYRIWLDSHRCILDLLNEFYNKLDVYHDDSIYEKIIDIDDTIFLFFFDS